MEVKIKLEDVLAVQSVSYQEDQMIEYIQSVLKSMPNVSFVTESVKVGKNTIQNIYATKQMPSGVALHYPCFVSHTDTVHNILDNFEICKTKTEDDTLFYGMTKYKHYKLGCDITETAGCGGDDKVGVWACLNLLNELDYAKVAFFAAEEVGTVGSGVADMTFFEDVAFVLQTDRKGNDDFVTKIGLVELSGNEFQNNIAHLLTKRGFKLQPNGGLTDVKELKSSDKGPNVAMANISSGYYSPHTDDEYVSYKDALNTLNLMHDIAIHVGGIKQEHTYEKTYNTYNGYNTYTGVQGYNKWGGNFTRDANPKNMADKQNSSSKCTECGEELTKYQNHKLCLNMHCTKSNVYTNYIDDGFYYEDAPILYPVYKKEVYEIYNLLEENPIAYYNDVNKSLYTKPFKIVDTKKQKDLEDLKSLDDYLDSKVPF